MGRPLGAPYREGHTMTAQRLRNVGLLAAAMILPLTVVSTASSTSAAVPDATVSVLHAIPAGLGADIVDVYAGTALLIDNLTPGSLRTVRVPGGVYNLGVYADGQAPGTGTALLSSPRTQVPSGANATVTANLDALGTPALNVFLNDTAALRSGQGRLTVRHVAAAPAVDVRANGRPLFTTMYNGKQAKTPAKAGNYRTDVVLAGTKQVAIGPATVVIKKGVNTIVYAWGSAANGTLALAVQEVPAK